MDRIDWNITEKIKKEVFMEKSENKVNVGTKKFNAVDLITVVVFAALVRVLWMVFKTAGVIFPFNHSFMHFFSSFCLSCMHICSSKAWRSLLLHCWLVCHKFFPSRRALGVLVIGSIGTLTA